MNGYTTGIDVNAYVRLLYYAQPTLPVGTLPAEDREGLDPMHPPGYATTEIGLKF